MSNCINKSHPEFKELLKATKLNPHILAAKISMYQKRDNTDEFPDAEYIKGASKLIKVVSPKVVIRDFKLAFANIKDVSKQDIYKFLKKYQILSINKDSGKIRMTLTPSDASKYTEEYSSKKIERNKKVLQELSELGVLNYKEYTKDIKGEERTTYASVEIIGTENLYIKTVNDIDKLLITTDNINNNLIGFPKSVDKDGQTNLFQLSNKKKEEINDKQSKQLENKVKKWLKAVGVQVDWVDAITDNKGNQIDAVAKADIIKRIIEVVQDKADVTTLPEEAAHFLVEMLGDEHPLVKKMMTEIESNPIYQEVVEEYGDTYNNDEYKLKKEAVGKLIAEHLTGVDNNITDGSKSWFKSIIKWFKQAFLGFNTSTIENELSSFREASDMILNMDTDFINRIGDSAVDEMYQLTNDGDGTVQEDLINNIETKSETIAEEKYKDRYMTKSGKIIKGRVSDLVSKVAKSIFGAETTFADGPNYHALKGTVLHMYNEVIVNALVSNKELSYQQALEKVHGILKDGGDFIDNQNVEFFEIGPASFAKLKIGMTDLIAQEKAKDPGMKVLTEQILVDDAVDIAGTVDLMFVYSDGSVSIYDYKTKMYRGDKMPEISSANKLLYSTQLSEYKRMLASKYGVTKFRQSRIIPIFYKPITEGKKMVDDGISRLDMWNASIIDDKLTQIPVAEEMTDDKGINTFIRGLMNREKKIRTELKEKYTEEKDVELSHIQTMIEKLQRDKDVHYVLLDLQRAIKTTQVKLKNNDLTAGEALDAKQYLELYKDLATNFVNVVRDGLSEAKDEDNPDATMEAFREFENNFNKLFASTTTTIGDLMQYIVDLENEASVNDLTQGSAPKSMVGKLFDGLAEWDNPVFQRLRVLISEVTNNVKRDVEELDKEVTIKDKALTAWAKTKGLTGIDKFKPIVNKDTGNLIVKINKTFYEDREIAKNTNNTEWAEENLTFNREEFNEWIAKRKKSMEDSVFGYSKKRIQDKIKSLREKYDPAVNSENWFKDGNFNIKIKEDINKKYISNEWTYMHQVGNEALLDYYNMYIDYNKKFEIMTDNQGRVSTNFIPNIRKDTIDRLAETGILGVFNLRESFITSLEVRGYDEMTGTIDENGQQINKIPLLFTDNLKGNVSIKEEKVIIEEVKKMGLEEGYPEFDAMVNNLIAKKERENGLKDKSYNLSSSLLLMADTAYRYSHTANIEDTALNIREILVTKQQEEISDNYGNKIKDRINRTISKALGVSGKTIDAYDSFMKLMVYGQHTQSKDLKMKIGKRDISLNKFISGLLNYQSFKSIGLNPVLAFANMAGTQANFYVLGQEGRYYDNKNAKQAVKNITGRDKKSLAAIGIIEPTAMDITKLKSEKLSATNMQKYVNNTNVFFMMKAGDDLIDNQIMLSMMEGYIVDDDGVIKNPKASMAKNSIKNKDAKPLSEFLKEDKDGNWSFEGVSVQELDKFRMKVQHVANLIKGSTGVEQDFLMQTSMIGKVLTKFKTWMPGLVRARFSKLRYMENIDDFEQGRFAVALGDMLGNGAIPAVKGLSEFMLEAVSFGLYKKEVNIERATFYMNKYNENNPNNEIKNVEDYIEFRKAKIKAAAAEVRIYMMVLAAFLSMGAADWDDKKKGSLYSRYSYRLFKRAYMEISFFFDPTSFTSIVKSPISVIRVLDDWTMIVSNTIDVAGEDLGLTKKSKGDKTGRFHYILKEMPVSKLVQEWSLMIDEMERASKD